MINTAILLVDCPDRKGIVAAIADFLYQHNANILHADQHQDRESQLFLMRIEWDLKDFNLEISEFSKHFTPIAQRFGMRWRLEQSVMRPKVAIFVSQYDHCLADLLYRHQSGELACEIPILISNHPDAERLAAFYKIPFHVIDVDHDTKPQQNKNNWSCSRSILLILLCWRVTCRFFPQILSVAFRTKSSMSTTHSCPHLVAPVPIIAHSSAG